MTIEINPADLRIDTFHAHEQGGFVHTNHTAVRITHLPTGAYVESKTERSLHRNKQRCVDLLPAAIEAKLGTRSPNRAEELITHLEAEIVKRDARIAELEEESIQDTKVINDLLASIHELKAQQPSAGVVLPEHRDADLRSPVYGFVRGWNFCLDEVARLNPCRAQYVSDGLFFKDSQELAEALGAVKCLHDMSVELIAERVFAQRGEC